MTVGKIVFFDGQLGEEGAKIPHRRHYFEAAAIVMEFFNSRSTGDGQRKTAQEELDRFRTRFTGKSTGTISRTKRLIELLSSDINDFV